jgi:hypothetical protein
MPADASWVIAIGLLLLVGYVVVVATVLSQRALHDGGEVEVEVRAPSLSIRLKTTGMKVETRQGNDLQHGPNLQE